MNKKLTTSLISIASASLVAISLIAPVSASAAITASIGVSASGSGAGVKVQAAITRIIARGDQEITRRTTALTALSTKIKGIVKLSDSQKATITANIQAQVDAMNSIKAKIDADTDAATLKTDVKSITDSYRIFALIIPKGRLLVAADRVATISDDMTVIGTKLQARITAAQSAGKDTTAITAVLADYNAKVADAQGQATTATTSIAPLVPDQGDASVAASNKATLVAARANIKTATTDLETARKDSKTILQDLKAFHLSVTASTTATVSQ